jgi:uncharacterized membrane protein YhaH (DUF805 family)
MESPALFFSASGRMAQKPFAIGVLVVYVAAFLSQLLISPPVMLRAGVAPFALVQAIASWAWFCLHAKRLRDAGRGLGPAIAIAILYALAMVLLLLIVALIAGTPPSGAVEAPSAGLADVLVLFFLIAMLTGEPNLGLFGYVVMGVFALIFMPMLIAFGFSIWAGTGRPNAPAASS